MKDQPTLFAETEDSPENLFEVIPLAGVGKPLTYRVGPQLDHPVEVGSLVRVPLRGHTVLGVVVDQDPTAATRVQKIRHILQNLYAFPVVSPKLIDLLRWMARYYAASPEICLETAIPAPVRRGTNAKEVTWIEAIREETDPPRKPPRGPRQKSILDFLQQQFRPTDKTLLLKRLAASPSSLSGLIESGWVKSWTERRFRNAYLPDLPGAEIAPDTPPELTAEQAVSSKEINERRKNGFGVNLLHGVTGSGKTEVYLRVIEDVLSEGGGVLFLVPEVMLAPQTVGRLRARLSSLGVEIVVWHSHLSEGERADAWMLTASGQAKVVVGARSAVFAPVRNLQLIVVDEEHEPAYKQDETPRYHGRDVAVMRAHLENAYCLLGSATPSLESFRNVERGKYTLSTLSRRVAERKLPSVNIIDMRMESGDQQFRSFSRPLVNAIRDRLERGEQTILFLNRRGFSTSLTCPECGHVMECPDCAIPYTYHRADHRLKCHLCADEIPVPRSCPSCGSPRWLKKGAGTQRIEDVIAALFPKARVSRLDSDAMSRRHAFREILSRFEQGKIDILVGTQMIAKGLDFPNVTLVGLVDADRSLHQQDFRAGERTFQLLVQVSGRAGRGERPGEVYVQTYTPKALPIQAACTGDFELFWKTELAARKEYDYPPFRNLIRHVFTGRNRDKLNFYSESFAKEVIKQLGTKAEIRGPAPAPLEKIKGKYRNQLWYFTNRVLETTTEIEALRRRFPMDPEIRDTLDVDAQSLL